MSMFEQGYFEKTSIHWQKITKCTNTDNKLDDFYHRI